MNIGTIDKRMRVVEEQGSVVIFDAHEDVELVPIFTPDEPAAMIETEDEIHELKQEAQSPRPNRVYDYLFTILPAMLLVLTNFIFSARGSSVNAELVYGLQVLITAGAAFVGWRRKSPLTVLIWLGGLLSMLVAPMVPVFFNTGFSAPWMSYAAYGVLVPTVLMFGRTLWNSRKNFLNITAGLLPIATMLTSVFTASTILRSGLLEAGSSSMEYLILDLFNTFLSYGLLFLGRKRRTRWAGLFTVIIYNIAFYASLTTTPLSSEMLPVWLAWVTPVGLGFLIDRWWQRRKRTVTL